MGHESWVTDQIGQQFWIGHVGHGSRNIYFMIAIDVCQVSLIFRFAYSRIQKYGKPNVANYDRWPYLVVI